MSIEFGDDDPDDGWDEGDTIGEQIAVIDRILARLGDQLLEVDYDAAAARVYLVRRHLRVIVGRVVLVAELLEPGDHPRIRDLPVLGSPP